MPVDGNQLPSFAERYAAPAGDLPAFGGFSLAQARRDLTEILAHVHSNGFFGEYSKHDISHVDAMLANLEWLIDPATLPNMTPADWLLIVLSAYFHDLGMLVTDDEYNSRNQSAFPDFKNSFLASSDDSAEDYISKVESLGNEASERFLYQEFVRYNHAARVRSWIEAEPAPKVGISHSITSEIQRILSPLDEVFRDDLAIVCESHHLDDLFDIEKYPLSKPYGSNEQETANVQYAAVMLRTIDMLHITRDRTPSVAFRLINPRDPVSQREWAKQRAVRAVRAKKGVDSDGNIREDAPRDTVEVHARFTDGNAYFGLTTYLDYAERQIRASSDLIAKSNQAFDTKHYFPWKYIDTSNVATKGFIKEQFTFTFDQAKILDLLTGHTLYNDSSVALRELIQNSLDAVRIAHGSSAPETGEVIVKWSTRDRVLEVWDNGTGMTQEVIVENFLKVGSSRYQDPQFRKENPEFNPISRFGIGVLSAFMVADRVDVYTNHPAEQLARHLELRSVHGKYLVDLVNKQDNEVTRAIGEHGTMVRLEVRPSAKVADVLRLARRWIIIPGCKVKVVIDDAPPTEVGFRSVSDALRSALKYQGIIPDSVDAESADIRVVEKARGNVDLAYVVRWDRFFNEWNFLSQFANGRFDDNGQSDPSLMAGVCVEGIRVEFESPGFNQNQRIWAIANVSGKGSPRTNVARSAIELTDDYLMTLRTVYELYAEHISEEMSNIRDDRAHSLTWAAGEAKYLISSLIGDQIVAKSGDELERAVRRIPTIVVEEEGIRRQIPLDELRSRSSFSTMESVFAVHMEYLLREISGSASLASLLNAVDGNELSLPEGTLVCTRLGSDPISSLLLDDWQVAGVHADEDRRRCDIRWVKRDEQQRWSSNSGPALSSSSLIEVNDLLRRRVGGGFRSRSLVRVPLINPDTSGFGNEQTAVVIGSEIYLVSNRAWHPVLSSSDGIMPDDPADAKILALSLLLTVVVSNSSARMGHIGLPDDNIIARLKHTDVVGIIDVDLFMQILRDRPIRVFSVTQWQRRGGDNEEW